MTLAQLDALADEMSPAELERDFIPAAEHEAAFGPAGWTDELIEEYESYLEHQNDQISPF